MLYISALLTSVGIRVQLSLLEAVASAWATVEASSSFVVIFRRRRIVLL